MKKRHIITATTAVAAIIGLTITGATFAEADTTETDGAHCVVDVSTGGEKCFDTFPAAVAEATGGRVTDAPADAAEAVADKEFEAAVNAPVTDPSVQAGDYLISIEYSNSGYGGSTYTFTAGRACRSDGQRDFELKDIRDSAPNWNDVISSFKGFSTCEVNHYEHSNFTGARTGAKARMSSMGAMNDKTTSLTWG